MYVCHKLSRVYVLHYITYYSYINFMKVIQFLYLFFI